MLFDKFNFIIIIEIWKIFDKSDVFKFDKFGKGNCEFFKVLYGYGTGCFFGGVVGERFLRSVIIVFLLNF